MKNAFLAAGILSIMAITACNRQKEGTATYSLQYQLPDSLRSFASYLPATAITYFKGDSVATVQGTDEESTTMITYKPTDYLLCLLKSGIKRYQLTYTKEQQASELPDLSQYEFIKGKGQQKIAGYNAQQYILKNKFSGDTTSAWFTKDISIPPNFQGSVFKAELGVPVQFSLNQNGMITKTTLKEIKFDAVPAGTFTAPAGYQKITPQQLNEMPVDGQ